MIFITSSGEIFLYRFTVSFFLVHFTIYIYIKLLQESIFSGLKILKASSLDRLCGKIDCDQMEHQEGEQYNQYPVERNPRAYMSMRDYRNPPWVSAPSYMVPPQYAPPPHPQSTSPMEEAILNLTKLVGDFVGKQKIINAHCNQRIDNVESSLSQKLDELQNDMFQKLNNLEDSISRLTNQQHVHSKEENPEEVYLSDTMVEEHCTLLTEESNGKEAVEEPKKHVLKPFSTKLNPTANAQATYNPLPVAPSTDQVYILSTPEAYTTPEAPIIKATPSLPMLKNFKKLVATVQAFATTSKTMAATHTACHSGWFGCWFRFGAPEPRHF